MKSGRLFWVSNLLLLSRMYLYYNKDSWVIANLVVISSRSLLLLALSQLVPHKAANKTVNAAPDANGTEEGVSGLDHVIHDIGLAVPLAQTTSRDSKSSTVFEQTNLSVPN